MPLLSIVIPAYNEEETVDYVMPELDRVLKPENIDFEVIFVDDGSQDSTFKKIKEMSGTYGNVQGYRFSRNFGKEAAIWAGFKQISGNCCVVMDCDLQHPPKTIVKMYRLWENGYEIVEGIKARERGMKLSNLFYRIISALSGIDMHSSSDFKLLDRRVVRNLLQFTERNTFFRGLSFWVGFRSAQVEYQVSMRRSGKTKWSFIGLTKYAISNIVGFSTLPMQLVTGMGILTLLASIVLAIHTLIKYFSGNSLEGFTTVILLLLFIGGGIMISLGIIGLYIAKIYDEVKHRPRFIISESTHGYSVE